MTVSFVADGYYVALRYYAGIERPAQLVGIGPHAGSCTSPAAAGKPLAHAPVAGNGGKLAPPSDLRLVQDHLTVGGEGSVNRRGCRR